jgi:FecR protein
MNLKYLNLQTSCRQAIQLLGLLCVACLMAATGAVQASGDGADKSVAKSVAKSVGEVSLVLGKAYIQAPGEARELIQVGTVISVNDMIETTPNGHVHIRFVDQALVSVRPSSRLEIVRYEYRPEAPSESIVKLNLVEGVTRAISGQAAKQARENFRMNTPIAAIGVRGTDFVVSANQQSVRALVNEGAIVVAPFSSQCSADTFGPCSQNSQELVSGAGQIVQINANALAPVLIPIPASAAEIPESMLGKTAAPGATKTEPNAESKAESKKDSSELYVETVNSKVVSQTIATAKAVSTQAPVVVVPVVPVVDAPKFTPDTQLSAQALTNSQLVWGRWSEARAPNERITVSYDTARADGRQAAVGNAAYGLFRAEVGSKEVRPGLGVVAFNLVQAQSFYKTEGRSELMDVKGGKLSIDFDQSLFATSLQLSHAATGNIEFNDKGRIFGGGYFHNNSDTQAMAGAVSLDGAQAGYFFEKVLATGSIEGLTLWGKQP